MKHLWSGVSIYLFIVIVIMSSAGFVYAYSPKAPNIAGTVLNPFLSGYKTINLKEEIKDKKVIIINFWATWCPPCREEIPGLIKFYKAHSKNVLIIGVNINVNKSGVSAFLKQYGVVYPSVYANIVETENYGGINFIPQSFFINNKGHIIFHWSGPVNAVLLKKVVSKMIALEN